MDQEKFVGTYIELLNNTLTEAIQKNIVSQAQKRVLEIENETGKILNWKPISKEELDDYLSVFDNDVSNE